MWQLRLNPSKCEALCITNKRSPLYFDYKIGGCSLHWSSSVKYLGIYINSKLNWNNHCTHMAAKATRILNLFQRHLFGCSLATKCRAFDSLVLPILEYSSQVWNPHAQKNVNQLEDVQLCAARWVCGSRYSRATHLWDKSSHQCCSELN